MEGGNGGEKGKGHQGMYKGHMDKDNEIEEKIECGRCKWIGRGRVMGGNGAYCN